MVNLSSPSARFRLPSNVLSALTRRQPRSTKVVKHTEMSEEPLRLSIGRRLGVQESEQFGFDGMREKEIAQGSVVADVIAGQVILYAKAETGKIATVLFQQV